MDEVRTPSGVARDKPALIAGDTGAVVTHGELAERAERAAAWLLDLGLASGDGIAMLLENRSELLELANLASASVAICQGSNRWSNSSRFFQFRHGSAFKSTKQVTTRPKPS